MASNTIDERLTEPQRPKFERFKQKTTEYVKRYGLAEVVAIASSYASFFIVHNRTGSDTAAAYASTMAENLGFYGTMFVREAINDVKEAKNNGVPYSLKHAARTTGKLITEFAVAEVLDTVVIRPWSTVGATRLIGRNWGVLAGIGFANIVFYGFTILGYEGQKKVFSSSKDTSLSKENNKSL